jgi:hypothetical protein
MIIKAYWHVRRKCERSNSASNAVKTYRAQLLAGNGIKNYHHYKYMPDAEKQFHMKNMLNYCACIELHPLSKAHYYDWKHELVVLNSFTLYPETEPFLLKCHHQFHGLVHLANYFQQHYEATAPSPNNCTYNKETNIKHICFTIFCNALTTVVKQTTTVESIKSVFSRQQFQTISELIKHPHHATHKAAFNGFKMFCTLLPSHF